MLVQHENKNVGKNVFLLGNNFYFVIPRILQQVLWKNYLSKKQFGSIVNQIFGTKK